MDSAGIRGTADAVEAEAVRRATRLAADCDVALLLFDAGAGPGPPPQGIPQTGPDCRAVVVANKIDLLDSDAAATTPDGERVVAVSAMEGKGLEGLEDALLEPYGDLPDLCRRGEAIVFTEAQGEALRDVSRALREQGPEAAGRVLRSATEG
jgi:tRNA modification GTPase